MPVSPKENPAEVVERIVKNSNAVGDKLAKTDTGKETRGQQDKILKDIESLIEQQENPPPQDGDDSKDENKDQNKNQDMNPKGGMDPKGDMQPKGGQQPKEGDGHQQAGRKPRQGEKGGTPKGSGKEPSGAKQDPGMAKANPLPGTPGSMPGGQKGKPVAGKPSLPIDDAVVKEIWGHLPDGLRQQVSQYYKEQFMPKYSELLKQYYSSLANNPASGGR
ncbi:MAG TPA: hypothetical protein VGL71_00160 [Urbifossiella sp.]